VVFLDLGNLKQLNDSDSHDVGDAALQATANDHVARLGGDEFAIFLPEIGIGEAEETGSKISFAINNALRCYHSVIGSIGKACFSEIDRSFPEMLKAADELMYEVKRSGKGSVITRLIGNND